MKRITLITIICIFSTVQLIAQEEQVFKRTIAVDGTYLLSFFKTAEARITPFNLKYTYKKLRFRGGFNLNHSTATNKGFQGDFKLGVEFPKKYSKKWQYYYGTDFNVTYISYNDRDNTTKMFSVLPFLGFEVFFSKEFSLGYEPKLIWTYSIYTDPSSFFETISDSYETKLSGLSQFFINFNF